MTMSTEEGAIHRLTVRGTARMSDLEKAMSTLEGAIGDQGVARLLIVLDHFNGWDPADNWSDLQFYVTHGHQIERIAIVGEPHWREETMLFALAGLRKAPVDFFVPGAISQARAWLAE